MNIFVIGIWTKHKFSLEPKLYLSMKDIDNNVIVQKSFAFAIRCVNLCKYLREEKKEYEMSKQLVRSGTSIGANVKEALRAQSKADFKSKLNISLKEASETEYWIELLWRTQYINETAAKSILADCVELIKLLTSIIIHITKEQQKSKSS